MHSLTQLHHFKLVAQERSFARAAELAHISQPALSNSIRSLETRLDLVLFERSVRPVTLTPAGRTLMQRVDALLFEARNLDQMLRNLHSGQGGHIRLGMTAVVSTSLAGLTIAEWHQDHPSVKLDLIVRNTIDLMAMLDDEKLDLIVGDSRDLRGGADGLDQVALPPQIGGAFCRPGHPILTIPRPIPNDLARYRFAGTHFPAAVEQILAERIGRRDSDANPLIAINSHNIAALRDAVAQSDLILLTTRGTVRNALALGLLREIPVDLGIDGLWSLATRRGLVTHPAVPALTRKIIDVAKRDHERRVMPLSAPAGPGAPLRP